MLSVETLGKIRRDYFVREKSIKLIVRSRGLSRNTVHKVMRGEETSFSYSRKVQPIPKLGPWVD